MSDQAKDVVKRLMCVDPVKRASLAEILEHKWIKNDTAMIQEARKIMSIEEDFLKTENANGGNKGRNKRGVEEMISDCQMDENNNNTNNRTVVELNNNKRLKNFDCLME